MERQPVESSQLASVGYDAGAEVLEIAFKPNKYGESAIWHYQPVGQEMYDAFMADCSKGSFFGRFIKNNPTINAIKAGVETT